MAALAETLARHPVKACLFMLRLGKLPKHELPKLKREYQNCGNWLNKSCRRHEIDLT